MTQTSRDMESPNTPHAGFWMRLGAILVDGIIIGAVNTIVMAPLLGQTFQLAVDTDAGMVTETDFLAWLTTFALSNLAVTVISWLYFALMESSGSQGTLGKRLLGIRVTDLQGGRIGFGKATGRYFGKILSGMVFMVGFLMAGFTEKKQALHDMLAGTLVVRR
jgi:uncharacterized RDD family membrane protein YckC